MSDLSLFIAGPFDVEDAEAVCDIRSYALPPVRKLVSSPAAVYVLLQSGRLLRIERSASGTVLMRSVLLFGERCEDISCAGNSCFALTSAAKPAAAKQPPKAVPDRSMSAPGGSVAVATRVLAWGDNSMGQLGLACTTRPIVEPTAVLGLSRLGVKSIFAGSTYSAAILQNGSVAFWGDLDGTPGAVPNVIVIPSRVFGCVASAAAQGAAAGSASGIPGFPVSIALGAASFVVLNAEGSLFEVALPLPEHMHVDTACAPGSSFPYVLQADTGASAAPIAASKDAVCIRFLSGGMLAGARVQAIAAGNGCFYALTGANAIAAWGERLHREWVTGQWAPRPVALLTPEDAQSLQRSLFGQSGGDTGRGGGTGKDAASARVIAWANRWSRLAVMPPARREEEVRTFEASLAGAPLPAFARGQASVFGSGSGGAGRNSGAPGGGAEDPGAAIADAPAASSTAGTGAATSAPATSPATAPVTSSASSGAAAAATTAAAKAVSADSTLYQPLGLAGGADAGGMWRSRSLCWSFAMQQLGPDALFESDLAKLARIARGKPLRSVSSEGEDVAAPVAAAGGTGGAGGARGADDGRRLGRSEASAVDGEESDAPFVRRGLSTLALLAAPDALPQWRASHTAMFFDFPTPHCLAPALGITREGRIAVVDGFVRPLRVRTHPGRVLRGSPGHSHHLAAGSAAASASGSSSVTNYGAADAAAVGEAELHADSSDGEKAGGDSAAGAGGDTMLLHNALSAFWATDVAQSRHFVVWLGRYDPAMRGDLILASATVTAGRYDLESERLRHVPRSLTLTITPPDIITGERGGPPVRMRGTWQGCALPHSLAVTAPAAGLSDELAARLALRIERGWRKQLAPWFSGPGSWRSHAHGDASHGTTPRYVSAALAVRNMLPLVTTAGARVNRDDDALASGCRAEHTDSASASACAAMTPCCTDSASAGTAAATASSGATVVPSDEQQYPEPRALDQSAFLLAPLPLVHPTAVALGSGGAGAIALPWPVQRIGEASSGSSAAGALAAASNGSSAAARTSSGIVSSAATGAVAAPPSDTSASADPSAGVLPALPLLPGSPSSTSSAIAAVEAPPCSMLAPAPAPASSQSASVASAWSVVPAMSSAAAAAAASASAMRDADGGLERCMRILHQAALLFSESRRRAAIATRRRALIARRQANAALKAAESQLADARAAAEEAAVASNRRIASVTASASAASSEADAAASAASPLKGRGSRSPSPSAGSAADAAAVEVSASASGTQNPVLAALLSSSSTKMIKRKDKRRGGEKGSMKGGLAYGKPREETPPALASPRGDAVADSAAAAALASAAQLATAGRAGAGNGTGSDAETAAVNRVLAELQRAEDAALASEAAGAADAEPPGAAGGAAASFGGFASGEDDEHGAAAADAAASGSAGAAVVEYEPLLVDVPPGAVFHSTDAAARSGRYAAAAAAALAGGSSSFMLQSGSEAGSEEGASAAIDADDDDVADDGADDGRSIYTSITGTVAGESAGAAVGRTAAGSGHAHVSLIAPTNWWERSARFAALCDFAYGQGWRAATVAAVSRHVLAQYARYAGLSGLRGSAAMASWFNDPLPTPTATAPLAAAAFSAASSAAPATVYDDAAQSSVSVPGSGRDGACEPATISTAPPTYASRAASETSSGATPGQAFAAALAAASPAAIQSLLTQKVVSKAARTRARARACADGMLLALRLAWVRRSVFASAVNTVAPDLVLVSPANESAAVVPRAASTASASAFGSAAAAPASTAFIADEGRGVVELGCVHAHVLSRRIPARFSWLAAAAAAAAAAAGSSGGGPSLHELELQPFGCLASEVSSVAAGADASAPGGFLHGVGSGSLQPASMAHGGASWRELATRTVEVCEELVQPLTLAPAITGTEAGRFLAAAPSPLASATSSASALSAAASSSTATDVSHDAAAAGPCDNAMSAAVAAAEAAVASAALVDAKATATVQARWPSARSLACVAEAGAKGSVADLLQYLYAGRVDLRLDNAQTILETADALLLPDARAAAEEFLCSSCIHEGSVRGLLELALHRNAPRLASCCAVYANRWNLQMPPHLAWNETNPAAFAASLASPVGPAGSSGSGVGGGSGSAAAVASPHGVARVGSSAAAAAIGGAGGPRITSGRAAAAAASAAVSAADVPGKASTWAASEEAASAAAALAAVFRRRRLEAGNPSGADDDEDVDVRHEHHDDADPGDAGDVHAVLKASGPPAGAASSVAAASSTAAPVASSAAASASTAAAAPVWGKRVWGKPVAAAAGSAPLAAVASAATSAAAPSAWGAGSRARAVTAAGSSVSAAAGSAAAAAVPLAASLVGAVDASAFPTLGAAAAAPATAALRRSRSAGGDGEGVRLYAGVGGAVEDYQRGSSSCHDDDDHHGDDVYGAGDDDGAAGDGHDDCVDHPVDSDGEEALQADAAETSGGDGESGSGDDDHHDDDDDVRHIPAAAVAAVAAVAAATVHEVDDPVGDAETHNLGP